MRATIGDIDRALASAFPHEWAEPWDRVGLLAGNADAEVEGVFVTLDADRRAVEKARAAGANVVISHHPAFLEPPSRIAPGRGASGILFDALSSGIALINAHTNLDRAPRAGHLLPELLDLTPVQPLESSLQPMSLVIVYVPPDAARAVADAMHQSGAGRVGQYDGCSFASEGTGSFTPRAGAHPSAGTVGQTSRETEIRLEMTCPPHAIGRVVAAARERHPFEEPLIVVEKTHIARSSARLGMLCTPHWECGTGCVLRDLAAVASWKLGITPRAWGDPDGRLEVVVTATGSASSLIDDALASGATALLAGEVRYHAAMDAVDAGLSIVEIGHDVSEWPLVGLLAETVQAVDGIDPASVFVDTSRPGWWTP